MISTMLLACFYTHTHWLHAEIINTPFLFYPSYPMLVYVNNILFLYKYFFLAVTKKKAENSETASHSIQLVETRKILGNGIVLNTRRV